MLFNETSSNRNNKCKECKAAAAQNTDNVIPNAQATPRGRIPSGVGIKIIEATLVRRKRRIVKKKMKKVGRRTNLPSWRNWRALKITKFLLISWECLRKLIFLQIKMYSYKKIDFFVHILCLKDIIFSNYVIELFKIKVTIFHFSNSIIKILKHKNNYFQQIFGYFPNSKIINLMRIWKTHNTDDPGLLFATFSAKNNCRVEIKNVAIELSIVAKQIDTEHSQLILEMWLRGKEVMLGVRRSKESSRLTLTYKKFLNFHKIFSNLHM